MIYCRSQSDEGAGNMTGGYAAALTLIQHQFSPYSYLLHSMSASEILARHGTDGECCSGLIDEGTISY